MPNRIPSLLAALALLTIANPQLKAQRLEFEVASVRPNTTNGPSDMRGPRRNGEFVSMRNTQIGSVIFYAYGLTANYQIAAIPALPDSWRWVDIEARAPAASTDQQIRNMFQALLEDRFKLKAHREQREVSGYRLTVNGKPKLTPAAAGPMTLTIEGRSLTQPEGTCGTSLWKEGNHTACHAVSLGTFVEQLAGLLRAPVADGTGLTGSFDLHFLYLPEERVMEANAPPSPRLADALQEVLGLRLAKTPATAEILVIDHIEPPTEN